MRNRPINVVYVVWDRNRTIRVLTDKKAAMKLAKATSIRRECLVYVDEQVDKAAEPFATFSSGFKIRI